MAEYSLEFLHPLWIDGLVGSLFWDAGQVDLDTYGLQIDDFRNAVGFGVGYELPMGLMRLDLGFPLQRHEWESAFQVHFDFGASF